jgi:hypothetical protein
MKCANLVGIQEDYIRKKKLNQNTVKLKMIFIISSSDKTT